MAGLHGGLFDSGDARAKPAHESSRIKPHHENGAAFSRTLLQV
jgi:hypothetical protein